MNDGRHPRICPVCIRTQATDRTPHTVEWHETTRDRVGRLLTGTAIGAVAGGKKGAAVGAAAGGIGGLIYDLATRNKK